LWTIMVDNGKVILREERAKIVHGKGAILRCRTGEWEKGRKKKNSQERSKDYKDANSGGTRNIINDSGFQAASD